jgi:hypothetical protein
MKINPHRLLTYQYDDGKFVRWDTIIRCIAAEEYIKTGHAHYLYKKDCDLRHFHIRENYDNYNSDMNVLIFEKMVRNFMHHGEFMDESRVQIYDDYLLYDGTHRLGISLAMNLDYVLAEILEHERKDIAAGLDYYKERFTGEELGMMINKYDELINKGINL